MAATHEWKVYFDGNFWRHHSRERACKEISLNRKFVWGDDVWYIPAIYTCGKGLVMDFCAQVTAERIRTLMDEWNFSVHTNGINLTDEQQMLIDAESLLSIRLHPKAMLNGTVLSGSRCCGVSWNPCVPEEDNSPEARSVTRHYGLDPAYGWAIRRAVFPWAKKRKPQLKTLSVTLVQEPVAVSGPHFHVSAPGACIAFTHPATSAQHTLTVIEYERREMSQAHLDSQHQEFPTHYTAMIYTLSPELPVSAFTVTDCLRSDMPRQKHANPTVSQASSVCVSAGIIGCAYGPTAIIVGGSGQVMPHAACSALRFEPDPDVEWRMVFYQKQRDDITVELISPETK